jgi:hypothetical protein
MFQPDYEANNESETEVTSSEDSEFLDGSITLWINPGASINQIWELKSAISRDPRINIITTGSMIGSSSYFRLVLKKPMPFLDLLHQIPVVREFTKEGFDIHVSLH